MLEITPSLRTAAGGRCGTAIASRTTLYNALGYPQHYGDNNKVTVQWPFKTPRGVAEVSDYWWNAPDEWSIRADNYRAALWLCRYLRRRGITASTRIYSKDRPKGP